MPSTISLHDRFQQCGASTHGEFDLALLVAEVIDHQVDHRRTRVLFDGLLNSIEQPFEDSAGDFTADRLLQGFNAVGFGAKQTSSATIADLNFSNLQWVMEHRQGIPISLAVLLIEAARRVGLSSHGINYPGHFLVSIEGETIDPLVMSAVDLDQLQSSRISVDDAQSLMQQATPKMLGLRMLNNVKGYYLGRRDWSHALDVVDYQFAIAHDDVSITASLHYERGEIWEQLGASSAAAAAYLECAQSASTRELAAKAEARSASLTQQKVTRH